MAEWIIEHMPPHAVYLEPFFGSGAVLFNKKPTGLETINDINDDVINLFKVIRDHPDQLAKGVYWTPYSRQEYLDSHKPSESEIEWARRFLVRCWQSIRVKTGSISGWKCRGTADDSYRVKQWNDLPSKIIDVAERLKDVQIENRPALQVIERYNRSDVMIYADPPYLLETRNGKIYENEMLDNDHIELIHALKRHKGPVILSGYTHPLYESLLSDWVRDEQKQIIENGSARTEVIWINPIAAESVAGRQLTLW